MIQNSFMVGYPQDILLIKELLQMVFSNVWYWWSSMRASFIVSIVVNNKFAVTLLTKCKEDNSRGLNKSKSSVSGCPTEYLENTSAKFLIPFM